MEFVVEMELAVQLYLHILTPENILISLIIFVKVSRVCEKQICFSSLQTKKKVTFVWTVTFTSPVPFLHLIMNSF